MVTRREKHESFICTAQNNGEQLCYAFTHECWEMCLHVTHRHHGERRVDDSHADSGVHRLRHTGCLKDARGKVEDLRRKNTNMHECQYLHRKETPAGRSLAFTA